MIAGHETTAATLGFTLGHLSQNPEWEKRCVDEIRTVLAGRAEPTYADLARLHVVEACFRESLRLHPPVGATSRDARADTTLAGKWLVRRGQTIQINMFGLHRREDVWGGEFGDVHAWNPARFLSPAAQAARHRFAFLPFGFAVRSCAGQLFAIMEAKTVLAVLLNAFVFRGPAGFVAGRATVDGGGAAPTPAGVGGKVGLDLHVHPRAGAPPLVVAPASPKAESNGVGNGAAAPAAAAPAAASPTHGTPLRVLYGSNGGTCEAMAASLAARAAGAGFAVTQAPLDAALKAGSVLVADAGATVVVTSTYNGHPPDNAKAFNKWLESSPTAPPASRFAVFGVGNSQWASTYLAFSKAVDAGLAAAGADRVRPLATADAGGPDPAEEFDDWAAALVPELAAAAGVAPSAGPSPAAADASADAALRAKLTPLPAGAAVCTPADVVARFRQAAGQAAADVAVGYHALPVTATRQLQGAGGERRTAHVTVALPAGLAYAPGDHLELLPRNAPAAVAAALAALGLKGQEPFEWAPVGAAAERGPARGLASAARAALVTPVAAADALAWLVDLAAPPSRRTVAALAARAACPPDKAALESLATTDSYKAGISTPRLSLVDLLARFPSAAAGFDLQSFINAAPRLTPRYYSIASAPDGDPTRCAICVGLVEYVTASGRMHVGPGSGAVHAAAVGDALLGTVRALQSSFRLPADHSVPIVMVGPGTGVAPMVGFLEARAAALAAGTTLGPAALYFGCRGEADHIFKKELEAWEKDGVLSSLRVAFSRAPDTQKTYVQDLIDADGDTLWPLLAQDASRVYVCGDARRMAPDVRAAFGRVAAAKGGAKDGAAWVAGLQEEGRYLEDVWAG
jgi:cytochrome P450/NADPH-cytochrome P450 reductase